jgi:hypothetical protein
VGLCWGAEEHSRWEPDALVYSHKQLDISYNGDRVSEHVHYTS